MHYQVKCHSSAQIAVLLELNPVNNSISNIAMGLGCSKSSMLGRMRIGCCILFNSSSVEIREELDG